MVLQFFRISNGLLVARKQSTRLHLWKLVMPADTRAVVGKGVCGGSVLVAGAVASRIGGKPAAAEAGTISGEGPIPRWGWQAEPDLNAPDYSGLRGIRDLQRKWLRVAVGWWRKRERVAVLPKSTGDGAETGWIRRVRTEGKE